MGNNSKENNIDKYLDLSHNQAENHAKTQQKIFEKRTDNNTEVTREIAEFIKTNIFAFTWHYIKSRFGKRHPYQFYPAGDDSGIFKLQPSKESETEISIALLSDWASDTIESDLVGAVVKQQVPDYTIHLGDVYFVGTYFEMEANFTAPYASWYFGESGSLALAGNHEMYSNGNAYFKHLLPAMYVKEGSLRKTQKAGFFCLENENWRIIGIDTAYTSVKSPFMEILRPPDCHLKKEQMDWLRDIVKIGDENDKRGIVILSHHPYFSSFREAYPEAGKQLQELMQLSKREIIWFWGHDHRLVLYKAASNENGPMVYGRCIGHGGLPVETDMPHEAHERNKLLLYDRRVRTTIKKYKIGYNGFAMMRLNGNKITALYRDLEGTEVASESWEVNIANGQLRHQLLDHLPELAI